jgi:hypothetical protein
MSNSSSAKQFNRNPDLYIIPIMNIQTMVKDLFENTHESKAGLPKHSLRATDITALFDGGKAEAIIQKRTGHKVSQRQQTTQRHISLWKTFNVIISAPGGDELMIVGRGSYGIV